MPATTVASALLLLAKPPKVLMQFQCCADMTKVPRAIKQALSHANVDLLDCPSSKSEAADRKIDLQISRFAELHPAPATIVLVSGDADFAERLSHLRHRRGYTITLLHSPQAKPALIAAANQAIPWRTFLDDAKGQIEKAAKTTLPKPAAAPTSPSAAKASAKKEKNAAKAAKAPPPAAKSEAKASPSNKAAATAEKKKKAPAEKAAKSPTCKKRHALQMGAFAPSGWECDACDAQRTDKSWHCPQCNYDLCFACYDKSKAALADSPAASPKPKKAAAQRAAAQKSPAKPKAVAKKQAGKKQHECPTCQAKFAARSAMNQHRDAVGHWTCMCNKSFKSKESRGQHQDSTGHDSFQCPTCSAWFKTDGALEQHQNATTHWRCKTCLQDFGNPTAYDQHCLAKEHFDSDIDESDDEDGDEGEYDDGVDEEEEEEEEDDDDDDKDNEDDEEEQERAAASSRCKYFPTCKYGVLCRYFHPAFYPAIYETDRVGPRTADMLTNGELVRVLSRPCKEQTVALRSTGESAIVTSGSLKPQPHMPRQVEWVPQTGDFVQLISFSTGMTVTVSATPNAPLMLTKFQCEASMESTWEVEVIDNRMPIVALRSRAIGLYMHFFPTLELSAQKTAIDCRANIDGTVCLRAVDGQAAGLYASIGRDGSWGLSTELTDNSLFLVHRATVIVRKPPAPALVPRMAVPQAQKPAPSVQAPKSALPRMAVPAPRPVREPLVPQSGDLDREERELSAAIAVSIASAALHPKAPAPPIAASASIPVATSAAEEAELAAAIEASLRESIAKQPATDSPTVDAAIPSAVTRASDSTVSAVAREADEKMEVHPAALTVEASSVTTPPAAADVHTSMPTTATAASGLTESVTLDDGGFVPVAGGTAEPLAPTAVASAESTLPPLPSSQLAPLQPKPIVIPFPTDGRPLLTTAMRFLVALLSSKWDEVAATSFLKADQVASFYGSATQGLGAFDRFVSASIGTNMHVYVVAQHANGFLQWTVAPNGLKICGLDGKFRSAVSDGAAEVEVLNAAPVAARTITETPAAASQASANAPPASAIDFSNFKSPANLPRRSLQADDGRFFMVTKDGQTRAGNEKQMWEFHARDDGTWNMLSVHTRCWVTAECKLKVFFGPVTCRRAFASGAVTFERWTIHCDKNIPNSFALKSFHGYFMAIKANGEPTATESTPAARSCMYHFTL